MPGNASKASDIKAACEAWASQVLRRIEILFCVCSGEPQENQPRMSYIYIVDFWIVLGIILCALVCMCSWRSTSWTKVKTKLVFLLEWGVGAVYLGHCFSHGTVGSSFLSTVLLFCFSDYFSFLCFLASLLYFLLLFSFFMLCCFLLLCFFASLLFCFSFFLLCVLVSFASRCSCFFLNVFLFFLLLFFCFCFLFLCFLFLVFFPAFAAFCFSSCFLLFCLTTSAATTT